MFSFVSTAPVTFGLQNGDIGVTKSASDDVVDVTPMHLPVDNCFEFVSYGETVDRFIGDGTELRQVVNEALFGY